MYSNSYAPPSTHHNHLANPDSKLHFFLIYKRSLRKSQYLSQDYVHLRCIKHP